MANDNTTKGTQQPVFSTDDTNTLLDKLRKNQKIIKWCGISFGVIVTGVLVYIFAFRLPGIQKANEAIGVADMTAINATDSVAYDQYKKVADNYGYDAGNRAHLMTAAYANKLSDYDQALKYVQDYDKSDDIIGATSKSLEGDIYVNKKDYDNGLKSYDEAIKRAKENPVITPVIMMKKATVLRAKGDYKGEAEVYRQIKANYPNYNPQGGWLDKNLKRAEIRSGQAK